MEENKKSIGQHEARDQYLGDAAPWSEEIKYDPDYYWCQCDACLDAEAAATEPFAGNSAHGYALLAFDAVFVPALDKLRASIDPLSAEVKEAFEEVYETMDDAVIAALMSVGVDEDCPVRMPFEGMPTEE